VRAVPTGESARRFWLLESCFNVSGSWLVGQRPLVDVDSCNS
jgi:hypothetical protein